MAVFVAMGVVLTSLRYGTHFLGLSGIARTLVFRMLPLAGIAFSAQRSLLAARTR